MEQTELKKVTSIDWLMTQLYKKGFIKEIDGNEPIILMNQAKEIENEQKGYSEEEVELIANEMVNWAIDNVGNPFPQSGKKFDEVLAKYKKK